MAQTMTQEEWTAEGERRFGADRMQWRFVCPSCKQDTPVSAWRKAEAPDSAIAFSCVGRWSDGNDNNTFKGKNGPCKYAGGGLFKLNPITVIESGGKEHQLFDFAPALTSAQRHSEEP